MRELRVVDAMELAVAYAAAGYAVEHEGRGHPVRVGQPATPLEAARPAARYAFITAWNPASDPRPDDANEAADARLVARLDALGIERSPARAQSSDGRWREPGWLLYDAGQDTLLALAREFGQAGVLGWARGEPVQLYMLMGRPGRPAPDMPEAVIRWVEEPATA
ncbi:DUF3293 domain-containing protein [Lysobacter sp. GX 14042]|uniref:DUF3293 domain-containing protein n=1 Tax=Lysobacter sp. GX 14042 TaxID=2907155 RepID=UPI001F4277EA|nr:DUF3293 domain-containing protein [Lysobacter sp. GX 14042]MCE7031228.1 DUF3293 domain-containing protein [Lysobacter sp. GX 14042]